VKWIVHYVIHRDEIAFFKCVFKENALEMLKDLLAMGYCCWITEDESD